MEQANGPAHTCTLTDKVSLHPQHLKACFGSQISFFWFKFTIGQKRMDGFSDYCNFNLKAVFNVTPKTKNKIVLINLNCTLCQEVRKRERGGRGGERGKERDRERARERERERERGREREKERERERERGGDRVNISNHLP